MPGSQFACISEPNRSGFFHPINESCTKILAKDGKKMAKRQGQGTTNMTKIEQARVSLA